MAVHDHGFRSYQGARTPPWRRPVVIARDALGATLATRKSLALLVASGLAALVFASLVYLHHNAEALLLLELPMDRLLPIDAGFFLGFLRLQGVFAFLLLLVAGPNLIAADLRDNALPLYLGRPLSRFEYVLGKLAVLLLLGSAVTWVPGLVLVGLQVALAGPDWLGENLHLARGVFFGSWVLILVASMACLALSALLRAKAAIEAAFVASFTMLALVGIMVDGLLQARWGGYLNIPGMIGAVCRALLQHPVEGTVSARGAAVALAILLALCTLMLARRVRAYEVVR